MSSDSNSTAATSELTVTYNSSNYDLSTDQGKINLIDLLDRDLEDANKKQQVFTFFQELIAPNDQDGKHKHPGRFRLFNSFFENQSDDDINLANKVAGFLNMLALAEYSLSKNVLDDDRYKEVYESFGKTYDEIQLKNALNNNVHFTALNPHYIAKGMDDIKGLENKIDNQQIEKFFRQGFSRVKLEKDDGATFRDSCYYFNQNFNQNPTNYQIKDNDGNIYSIVQQSFVPNGAGEDYRLVSPIPAKFIQETNQSGMSKVAKNICKEQDSADLLRIAFDRALKDDAGGNLKALADQNNKNQSTVTEGTNYSPYNSTHFDQYSQKLLEGEQQALGGFIKYCADFARKKGGLGSQRQELIKDIKKQLLADDTSVSINNLSLIKQLFNGADIEKNGNKITIRHLNDIEKQEPANVFATFLADIATEASFLYQKWQQSRGFFTTKDNLEADQRLQIGERTKDMTAATIDILNQDLDNDRKSKRNVVYIKPDQSPARDVAGAQIAQVATVRANPSIQDTVDLIRRTSHQGAVENHHATASTSEDGAGIIQGGFGNSTRDGGGDVIVAGLNNDTTGGGISADYATPPTVNPCANQLHPNPLSSQGGAASLGDVIVGFGVAERPSSSPETLVTEKLNQQRSKLLLKQDQDR